MGRKGFNGKGRDHRGWLGEGKGLMGRGGVNRKGKGINGKGRDHRGRLGEGKGQGVNGKGEGGLKESREAALN